MMDLLEQVLGPAIILSVVGVTAYSIWSNTRSQARSLQGICTRCGRPNPTHVLSDGRRMVSMCDTCARTTRRHHWAAYYFFLWTGILAGIVVAVGLATDLSRGYRISGEAITLLVPVAMPLAAAWWIWHRIQRGPE